MRGMWFMCLHPCCCPIPVQTVVVKDFIKSVCVSAPTVAHIRGRHHESVPTCWSVENGVLASLWFLWGPALVLGSCCGWDWCYKGVGGNCCQLQESVLRGDAGVDDLPAQGCLSDMVAARVSFCCCLLISCVGTTLGAMWCLLAHIMTWVNEVS